MHEWSLLLVSLCWRHGVRRGSPTQYHFASVILEWYHVIRTQTPIWHVTVRETNATGDCSKLACFSREHDSTMAVLHLRALSSMHPGCKPSAPTLAHPQPDPPPPLQGSTYCHRVTIFFVLLTYWLLILIVVVTVVFFSHFALHLWHLSLLVPFHKLVQQNWPW